MRPRVGPICVILAGISALAVGGWWLRPGREGLTPLPLPSRVFAESPPDPRLTFPTPFCNVQPDVGDAACAAGRGWRSCSTAGRKRPGTGRTR